MSASISSTPPIYNGITGGTTARSLLLASPEKYSSLSDFVDPSKPDNRDLLVKTFGDQGITGFLQLTGAVKAAAVNDEIQWWEEGRLHNTQPFYNLTGASSDGVTMTFGGGGLTGKAYIQKNDVIMVADGTRYLVTDVTANTSASLLSFGASAANIANDVTNKAVILGNLYAQGTDQPGSFYQPQAVKRTNPFMIVKGNFEVNGSQATNIGWIDLGGGEYRWYMKGEQDTRKRFQDHREMMLLFGEKTNAAKDIDGDINGSEGYFAAIEDRGIVINQGVLEAGLGSAGDADANNLDALILELDKQGGASEYAMYLNRQCELAFDDVLTAGLSDQMTAGVMGQYGAFNNDRDMALQLGFKSATRGGYTFHKHGWKLMNDPTLAGAAGDFKGAMVPLTEVADPGTGEKAPALELNYKAVNGYSRELEHWVTGGGVLGHTNGTKDTATFSYRSEIALCTRAANRHVLVKG